MAKKTKKIVIKTKPKKKRQTEVTRLGAALRTLGGLGGRALGSFVGMGAEGSGLGTGLGAALSRWLGSGDYTISSNSIVQRVEASGVVPAMHREGQSVIIRHKEYLGEIRGRQGFTVTNQFPINPGMYTTFPWLSRIANAFQEYRIKGMVYHYIPTSGNAVSSTNAALGSVMIQTTYRSNDAAPTSKIEMLNEYWSSESKPSEAFCHPVECNPKENPFNIQYVRNGAIPSNDSVLMYDLGLTTVAVGGQQADNTVLGDLWVTYEIELKKPILSSNVTDFTPGSTITITDVAGSITGSTLFSGTQSQTGNVAMTLTGNTLTFPQGAVGDWLVRVNVEASTTFSACNFSGLPVLTNCVIGNVTPSSQYIRTVIGGTSPTLNRMFFEFVVRIVEPGLQAVAAINTGTLTGSALATNVSIIRVE